MRAAAGGHVEAVTKLAELGADLAAADKVSVWGYVEVVTKLAKLAAALAAADNVRAVISIAVAEFCLFV